ncbi:hypothetical protein BD324DRAFT_398860 [Kockovaella imperatae]|uniref:Uncharacterized protein n=1 Tax=Kockovaella imperatae TaxID=4999 RepID=A0A1Y1UJR4_9TREE|nr:hypothetical protein BD324DRAFT_398860 [Kockovaella imperatae]ORX37777.1 hypothetical protein BD324DRAFT_398860 [Kockovaella imperatae]
MTVVRVNTTPLRPARTPPRPAQTQITGDEDEPPPPPYAPDDPEPDQTRILEQRLISEAEAEGRISSELPGEPRYSPPAGPPPLSSSASRRTPPTPNRDRPPTPDSPPADEQVRLAWEESQLDEAKRASLAAEQERLELEEAMRLSLAEAEIAEVASSVAGPSTRPSNPRPLPDPRQSPQYNQFTAAQALSPPLPLRPQTSAESFKRPQQMPSQSSSPFSSPWVSQRASPSIGHRRTASDVGPGMARLSLNEFDPLAEDDGQMSSLPVMQPTQHAAVLQSNNPFLSPRERLETKSSNESLGKPSPPNTATTTTGQIPQPRRTMSTLAEGEDPLEALRTCDTVFLSEHRKRSGMLTFS